MQLLQDIDGYTSSKRVALILCVSLIVASWVANVFFGVVVDAGVLQAIEAIGGISGTGIAAERFGKMLE